MQTLQCDLSHKCVKMATGECRHESLRSVFVTVTTIALKGCVNPSAGTTERGRHIENY